MKKKLSIIILLLIVLIPSNIKAATGSVKIVCDKEKLKSGDSTTCTISGNTDSELIGISAILSLSDNLIFKSFTKNSSWSEGSIENNKLDIYSENYLDNNFTIGTIIIDAKSDISNTNEKITLKDITFQNDKSNNAEENSFTVNDSSVNIRIPSNDNLLKNLTVSNISFEFKENITNIQLETTETSVTISATAKDSNAKVTGDIGIKNLSYGGNNFSIKVTSESGDAKVYTLNIIRPDNRSKENYLNNFKFSNYNLYFSKDKMDYNITLENNINKLGICDRENNTLCINMDSIKTSDKSTHKIIFNDKNIDINTSSNNIGNINVGNNTLLIVVKAENNGERTYTFNINRKILQSNNDKADNDNTDKEITNNSQTGDGLIIGIGVLLILSLGITAYLYKNKMQKEN